MDTPVLIPNTEVKHISGDNIWTGSSEDSTLPGNLTHLTMGLFFVFVSSVRSVDCVLLAIAYIFFCHNLYVTTVSCIPKID